jgi:mRNA interferase MazF
MKIKQFDIWIADLNPTQGSEPGKVRTVVIIQTDLLNNHHPSTIICPISTNVIMGLEILRVHLRKNQLEKKSDILVDQIRAIDNKRFLKKVGTLNNSQAEKLIENIKTILDTN